MARPRRTPASLVRRMVEEACNNGDLTILDEVLGLSTRMGMDPGCRRPEPGTPAAESAPVVDRLRDLLGAFRMAVPDARWRILELVADGETVATRLQVQGSFSGRLVGLAPPGRPATLSGVAISRFAHGRLVELWLQADLLGFLQQLGVLSPLELTQAVTMARVLHAGTVLADGLPP